MLGAQATGLPTGTDLNDIVNTGVYYAGNSSVAQTLVNCPTTTGFRLFVIPTNNSNHTPSRFAQIIICNGTTPTILIRDYTGSFTDWYVFKLEVVP